MADTGVTVDISDFLEGLDLDMAAFQRKLPDSMSRIGSLMVDYAQSRAPKKTGRLKDSITCRLTVQGLTYIEEVGTNVEYAPYVEFGTGDTGEQSPGGRFYGDRPSNVSYTAGWPGQRAQPYLRPAVYDNEDVFVEIIMEALSEAIR